MPQKIRQIKALLSKSGFTDRPAKGSHTFWTHPLLPDEPITVAGQDGNDAPKYLEKQVNRVLRLLTNLDQDS